MIKNSFGRRVLAALLSIILIVAVMPAEAAFADTNVEIQISSVEDLLQMSKNCHMDEWSRNKTVILTTDLDLSGVDYEPIPVFAGTFDGNRHVIKGLNYSGNGYVAGLFRYIAEDGVVKNLDVEGEIANTDEKQCIGGVCGENAGVISHCEFHGTINGRSDTGGIAGINAATGTIEACEAGGVISGYYSTGGIAGKNHGIIVRCTNSAGVNNSDDWVETGDENSLDWLTTLYNTEQDASLKSGTDTGGIVGFSDGIISSCTNIASIGYAHTGYNVGGIAGRQSGMMTLCKNTGRVYGRRDVGGIVGQMEPYLHMDKADSINDSIEKLHDLINQLLDDIDKTTGTISEDYHQLQSNADAALDTSHDMVGQVSDFVDKNMDQVNLVADRLRYVIDELPSVQDEIMAATDALDTVNFDLKKINEDLAVIDQMEDTPYAPANYARLTLLRSIGGKITANNNNPAQGISVTITVTPDAGYELKSIKATAEGGTNIALLENEAGKYVFQMPEQNVVVQAVFQYQGNYLAASNAGGTVSFTTDNNDLKIRAIPDRGYELEHLTIGSKSVDIASFNGNHELTVSQSAYPANEGKPVIITGKFVPQTPPAVNSDTTIQDESHSEHVVTALSATGGKIHTTRTKAESGTSIQLLCTVDKGYLLKYAGVKYADGTNYHLTVKDDITNFIMPDQDVEVYAVFEPVAFILTSTPGGSGTYSITEDRVTFTITPDAGFSLEKTPVVTDADGNTVKLSKVKANAYVYEFLLYGPTQPIRASVEFCGQNQYDALQAAIDVLNNNSAELSGAMENCRTLVNEISGITLDSNGNPVKWGNIPAADRETILKDIISIAQELSKAGSAAANMASSISKIANITHTYVVDTATAVNKDIDVLTGNLQAVIDHIEAAEAVTDGIMNYLSAQEHLQFSKPGEEFNRNIDTLYDQFLDISDSMAQMEQDISDSAGRLTDDFQLINDQMNAVFLLFAEKLDQIQNPDITNYYKDLSDENIANTTTGKVQNCMNYGSIEGDTNIGGVAGTMSIDEEQPENNSVGKTDFSFKGIYSTKCVLSDCKNYGYITAKKNNAGCVAGAMLLGIASHCEAYGGAKSSEGDYVGGIAGYSEGVIRGSYALCSLNGASYIGGIAGFGTVIENCYAMVDADTACTRVGAIAGQIGTNSTADFKEQSAHASHNYYVGDDLYGIDNISYVDVAEPITYDELLTTVGLPTKFRHLTVSFLVDHICVKEYEVAYGEDISNLELPEIPAKPGQNGVWPDLENRLMSSNLVLEAQFEDDITVLQSEETNRQSMEDGTVSEKPYAFAEGVFTGKSILHASLLNNLEKNGASSGSTDYEVLLENTAYDDTSELIIRLQNPYDEKAVVYRQASDGTWQAIDAKTRGEYMQLVMTGIHGIYRIEQAAMDLKTKILIGAGSAAAFLLVLLIVVKTFKKITKRRKNRTRIKKEKNGKEKEETA